MYISKGIFFRFETKGTLWNRDRPQLPPGLPNNDTQSKPACTTTGAGLSKAAKKNMKRKEKKQQQKSGDNQQTEVTMAFLNQKFEKSSISSEIKSKKSTKDNQSAKKVQCVETQPDDKEKKLRNLRKKLKQIIVLQDKVDKGELEKLDKQAIDKLSRRSEIEEEIAMLDAAMT